MTTLDVWGNFYVIVGSSAGALIGLQFVVLTLMADMPVSLDTEQATHAFTTPSVVHFQVVLFLSAIICAPWGDFTIVAVLWGLAALFGIVYSCIVIRRFRKQDAYDPLFEDWFHYVLLPLAAYLTLLVSACAAHFYERPALFGVGAAMLLLLFTGIHNAWDLVTHMVFIRRKQQRETEKPDTKTQE
jgi:hypothetical protein